MGIYYAKMKFGELIGVYGENENKNSSSKIKWSEKTAFGFNYEMITKRSLLHNKDSSSLSNLFTSVSKLKGLVFINVLFPNFNSSPSQQPLRDQIRALLSQNRKLSEKMDKVVLNFITEGSQTNEINCLEGANFFYYENHEGKNTFDDL